MGADAAQASLRRGQEIIEDIGGRLGERSAELLAQYDRLQAAPDAAPPRFLTYQDVEDLWGAARRAVGEGLPLDAGTRRGPAAAAGGLPLAPQLESTQGLRPPPGPPPGAGRRTAGPPERLTLVAWRHS